MTLDPFHPTHAYSRTKDVAVRTRHDDLQELRIDKEALEAQVQDDRVELNKLAAEIIRLQALHQNQSERLEHNRTRLQNVIHLAARLELQETER